MGIVKHTCKPDDHMQLKDSIVKCLNEGLLPIMHDGTELEGHTFLDGKEVASINVEKLKVKRVKKMWTVRARLSDYGYSYVTRI